MSEVRYYLDENIATAVAYGLRLRGIDVRTVVEAKLRGATDERQLEFARLEGRDIFTLDSDFVRLAAAGARHAGIVYAPRQVAVGAAVRTLVLIRQLLTAEEMVGQIEFV